MGRGLLLWLIGIPIPIILLNLAQLGTALEPGDLEAAMQTASAIGDDRIQRQSQGYVVPDAFTHGSSAQRTRWFTGLKSGRMQDCDTFKSEQL
jgi:predicted metalloprotease